MDDESNGVVAAEITVLVPNLRASLRVMCPLIVFLSDSQDYIPVKPLSTPSDPHRPCQTSVIALTERQP